VERVERADRLDREVALGASKESGAQCEGVAGTRKTGQPPLAVEELRGSSGLMLGRDQGGHALRYSGDGHMLTVAPTRAGKGIGLVIPALLTYPGAMVVSDPKGENYRVSAARRRAMGHHVIAFDPYHVVTRKGSQFNALDLVTGDNAEAGEDAWYLADLLVDPEERGSGSAFWHESARAVLAGLTLYVATSPGESQTRTLPRVRELLTLPPPEFSTLLSEMWKDQGANRLVGRTAAQLRQLDERTRAGVLATCYAHTHFLDSPLLAAALRRSSVRLDEIAGKPVTVYIVIPNRRAKSARRYARLLVGSILRYATRRFAATGPTGGVLFLLDEFQNLGQLDPIEHEFTVAAGAGVRFWLIAQDIAGLQRVYPKSWETFVSNADVTTFFGINDVRTAELVSKLVGDSTVRTASENRSTGVSYGRTGGSQEGASASVSEHARRLLLPDEARRLGREEVLIFPRGAAPVRARRIDYRTDVELR
jgi:type IV secretion system protein VirD4